MGKHYEEPFRRLVCELGPASLVAFVAADGVDARYREHILDLFDELGVAIAETVEAANFVIGGYVVRESDGAVGLAIETERMGPVDLFADAATVTAAA